MNALPQRDDGLLPSYAWPGGYPLFYLSQDGTVYCAECASQRDAEPPVVTYDINYEDPLLFCEGCGL
jgi:hypothetical protein